jgi:hypothetical protein
LKTLACHKIDEARAEAARQRLYRAAEQPRRHHAGRGFLGLLRDLARSCWDSGADRAAMC